MGGAPFIDQITAIGFNLAKTVFQIHAADPTTGSLNRSSGRIDRLTMVVWRAMPYKRCKIGGSTFYGAFARFGSFPPPSFVAGMEELASMPDTSVANCWPASGYRSRSAVGRITPATGASQSNRPSRRAAVAPATGQCSSCVTGRCSRS
jgi:hypothetical protein